MDVKEDEIFPIPFEALLFRFTTALSRPISCSEIRSLRGFADRINLQSLAQFIEIDNVLTF